MNTPMKNQKSGERRNYSNLILHRNEHFSYGDGHLSLYLNTICNFSSLSIQVERKKDNYRTLFLIGFMFKIFEPFHRDGQGCPWTDHDPDGVGRGRIRVVGVEKEAADDNQRLVKWWVKWFHAKTHFRIL